MIDKVLEKLILLENCSEDMRHHVMNNLCLCDTVYRPGSDKYFSLYREARKLYVEGLYFPHEDDLESIVHHEIGEFGMYEGNLVPLDFPMFEEKIDEAKYKGREVKLGKAGAQRVGGGKARVYVRDPKTGKVKPVKFGSSMPDAMGDSDEAKKRRKSFGDRHNCADKDDKTAPGYWSCRLTKMFGRNIPGWW